MPKSAVCVLIMVCWGLCACRHPAAAVDSAEARRIPLRILYQSDLCGGKQPTPSVSLVAGADRLDRIFAEVKAGTLGPSAPMPGVDFTAVHVVDIRMGQKPTGGYGIELADSLARLVDGEALIRLNWIEPAPGTVVTQVLTSPCLIIAVPKDAYERITLTDASGNMCGKISLP